MKTFHDHPEYLRLVRPIAADPSGDHADLRLVVADWLEENQDFGDFMGGRDHPFYPWMHRAAALRGRFRGDMGADPVPLDRLLSLLMEPPSDRAALAGAVACPDEDGAFVVSLDIHSWQAWDAVLAEGMFARHPLLEVRTFHARASYSRQRQMPFRWHERGDASCVGLCAACLPHDVFLAMAPAGYAFDAMFDAVPALWAALLALGRERAGLPALEPVATAEGSR